MGSGVAGSPDAPTEDCQRRGDAPAVGCLVAPTAASVAEPPPAELRVQDSLLPPTIGLWCAGDARDWRRLQATLPARG